MSKNSVFKNIVNSKNSPTKTKQKSILDYFNKKCPQTQTQTKRNLDEMNDNLLKNKCHKTEDIVIDIIDDIEVTNKSVTPEVDGRVDTLDYKEFIDLNRFLQINFSVEDKQFGVSVDESVDNQKNGYDIYQNFREMIDYVLKDEQLYQLFDENDLNIIQVFTCLSGMSQMLFIRLFMRKRVWIRKSAVKYLDIAENLGPIFKELVDNKFLFNANDLSDLSESLDVLDANEMKRIGKSLNGLNCNGVTTKKNLKNLIINYLNTCRPVLKSDNQSINEILLKSIRNVMRDKCFRVNNQFCDVFERMFLLYCRPELFDDNDFNTQINYEFFKIFRAKTGTEIYPKYQINRNAVIYKTREDLLNYSQAFRLEIRILSAIEDKNFDLIINDLIISAKQSYFDAIKDKSNENDSLLPLFLRHYTSGQTYIRCISHCVSVLEQKKNHLEAVNILRDILLSQTTFCVDLRGRWFERLSLNIDKHLKDPISALQIIEDGLKDEWVRTGHRFSLYIRKRKIKNSLKMKFSPLSEFETIKYNEITIFAETIKYTINDRKNIFKTTDSNGDVTVMSVEDISIKHYKSNGFSDGIHTESRIYHTIFGLLFWDIIYMSDSPDVTDAFRFQYQRLPLDFSSDEFYIRRKTQINALLNALKNMNETELTNVLENSWNNNFGTVSLINWQNNDIKQIKEIANCLGSSIITDICDRLIRDFRHTRSGFPDLLVWNSSNNRIKAVEVKGPNDKPSTKQQLWLSYLTSIGVDVEICHVKVNKTIPLIDN